MKRILYVYHASNIGGGTYCLLNILKAVDRNKIEPIVMLKKYGSLVDEIKKLNISVEYFPEMSQVPYNKSFFERDVLSRYIGLACSQTKFKNKIAQLKVDAVYLNTIVLAPYLRACKEIGLKTIIHIREHWPLNEHKLQLRSLQNTISAYADEIVAINSYSASMIPDRKVTIVYDWIDFSERNQCMSFDDIFKEDASNLKIYLYAGGDQSIKGFYEVINAFSNYINDSNSRLLILGVGQFKKTKGFKGYIKKILYTLGFDSKRRKAYELIAKDSRIVTIPGTYKINHILQQTYCNLSYFTIPHANLTLAECIVLGTMSIAAKNEEALEYSNNGELALLYESNNFGGFIDAIKSLDENYSLYKQALNNNSIIIEKFDKTRNINALSSVYSKLF